MALKPLKVQIGGDTSGLDRALNRAGRNIKGFAVAVGAAGAAAAGALALMTTKGLQAIDAQAKLARSLGTTVSSMQNLERAGELAGVSMSGIEQATKDLTRRLSQAAAGTGPARDALKALGLSAQDLMDIPLDQRVDKINSAIRKFVPEAQRAAVAGMLFGEEGSIAISRLDSATIRQATEDMRAFGVTVSDEAAAKIEVANDALSRMQLAFTGLQNKLAVEVAPVLQSIADQFNAFASSDSAQAAIERLVSAFGALAQVILSEDFLGAAVSGLEMIANTGAAAAEMFVTLSNNVEIVTLAFSGLAIAVAAAGGPITLVAGALAVALGGIAAWRKELDKVKSPTDAAKDATVALNAALGTFSDVASPNARGEAIALANENYKLADAAMAAAEAEIAKMAAAEATMRAMPGIRLSMEAEAKLDAERVSLVRDRMKAEEALARAQEARNRTARRVLQDQTSYTLPPVNVSGGGNDDVTDFGFSMPSIGGGAAVQDELAQRLDALQTGLMTEREFIEAWYAEGQEVLRDAREAELLTEQEYMDARQRLEEEHQDRLAKIREIGEKSKLQLALKGGAEVLQAMGAFNKRALKLSQVFAAGEALISTYRGAAKELEKGTFGFATAAAVIAKGLGFVAAIRSVSDSGAGGSAASAGGAIGQPAARPVQNIQLDLIGAGPSQVQSVQTLVDTMIEANRQGYDLNAIVRAS